MDDEVKHRLEITNLKVNQFMIQTNMDPMNYNYSTYIDDLVEQNNATVIYEMPHSRFDIFSGLTVKTEISTGIFIHPCNIKERQNFSLCHETDHIEYDFDEEAPT